MNNVVKNIFKHHGKIFTEFVWDMIILISLVALVDGLLLLSDYLVRKFVLH